MGLRIGVANSISANFNFDPIDTIDYVEQGRFDSVQIYLNAEMLGDAALLRKLKSRLRPLENVYYHAEGYLNEEFLNGEYNERLFDFLKAIETPNFIIHFDERANIDKLIRLIGSLSEQSVKLYVENYFHSPGTEKAEKNLKKYMALFTLSINFGHSIHPVFDIPRIFHKDVGFEEGEALEWCYQMLNFFGNRRIPMLLHLIDASSPEQNRTQFTALGEGYLPYKQIFNFIRKTQPLLEGVILEFEDKLNPLQSREYLQEVLPDYRAVSQ